MDKELFEAAIAPYVEKIVDPETQLTSYKITTAIRRRTINRHDKEVAPKGRPPRKEKLTVTPAGTFRTAYDASVHYNVTPACIYAWIKKAEKLGTKEYYFEES